MWNHSAVALQLPSHLCPSTGWVEFCWPCTYTAWSIGSRASQFRTCVLNSVSLSTYYKHRRETRRQASYRLGFVDFPIWQPTLDMVRDSYFLTWKLSNLKRPQLSRHFSVQTGSCNFVSLWKFYSCSFIPNCTRNDVIIQKQPFIK